MVEKLQIASEGLILTESQQRILAHRLTREFVAMQPDIISVAKLRELIDKSLVGIPGVIPRIEISEDASSAILKPEDAAMTEIGEDAYRANHIVKQD